MHVSCTVRVSIIRGSTYLLVLSGHVGPSLCSLDAHGTLGHLWTEITGNDGTRRLHVEEERGEGTLGRIRVVLTLLPLLLAIGADSRRFRGSFGGAGNLCEVASQLQQRVVAEALEGGGDIRAGAVVAEDGIGVLDVGGGDGADDILEGGEPGDDLEVD